MPNDGMTSTPPRSPGENGQVVHLTITRLLPPHPSAPVNGVVFKRSASPSPSAIEHHYSFGFASNGSP